MISSALQTYYYKLLLVDLWYILTIWVIFTHSAIMILLYVIKSVTMSERLDVLHSPPEVVDWAIWLNTSDVPDEKSIWSDVWLTSSDLTIIINDPPRGIENRIGSLNSGVNKRIVCRGTITVVPCMWRLYCTLLLYDYN